MDLGVNWAMLVAAVAGIGTGAVWYGIFGEPWTKAVGVSREALKPSLTPYVVAVVANLLIAFVLGNLMRMFEITGWVWGLVFGFLFWLGFIIPILAMNNAFARRPMSLTVIDGGHAMLNVCLQGVVLASFNVGAAGY